MAEPAMTLGMEEINRIGINTKPYRREGVASWRLTQKTSAAELDTMGLLWSGREDQGEGLEGHRILADP